MDTSAKPTFILVPGIFHTPVHGQLLADALHAKGYPTESISHPTIGPLATTAPLNADPANIRQVLEKLINDQEREVILMCHSYGGIPGSQVKGLERSGRAKAGLKGGIVKQIYLSAILPLEGENTIQACVAVGLVGGRGEWVEMDTVTGTVVHTSKAAPILFHDLPNDQAEYWASKLEPIAPHFNSDPCNQRLLGHRCSEGVHILQKGSRPFT
ncbi:AB hydrolase-1 domain-containing protein [Mycena venus]|uniref:AB hydrolase-1 domain-containing protein n=1 Tax=Mycena venus TaxID=2733690 RepID=A0A8H6YMF6_9AGAR|nr:AB hydrolase-1 domain-containing protein [Mycena venus]